MRRIVTWRAPLVLAVVATTGCATKDRVNDKLGKKQAQMDERFLNVDGRVGAEEGRSCRRTTT